MEKLFAAAVVEQRISAAWDEAGAFRAGRPDRVGAQPFCMVIPPPNVTGSLHIGHALNNTLQDVLCRFERMRGKDVLWQPGMDHAGIATQMVVERQLAERQQPDRRSMGRKAFIERVWAWKDESGGQIVGQLQRLGASCDWSRTRFTMDEGLSAAVLKVFVTLYRQGLIYKDKRLVNWDPKFLTAISDLEVVPVEIKGSLWHFRYPVVDAAGAETGEFITVATTRPETLLGDTAVAVHPEDDRYRHLQGRQVRLPLVGRLIPIVADDYSDPEKGSGAVKITPAHDFNDFEVGKRHGLPMINILDAEARLLLVGNEAFLAGVDPQAAAWALGLHGQDRFVARKAVVARMEELGLLAEVEPHALTVPHGDRSNVVIEPWLTDQWYVDAATLATPALAAVREGKTSFIPKTWEKTYFEWLDNIQPWCVSRQLWWGHQIPAWYGPDGTVFVAMSDDEAHRDAAAHYGAATPLTRDEDVLDTWFSSALWPFSTLGWPDQTPELARFYPTATLVTGFDIIFFWVARMMMMGLHFTGEVPFKDVYMHALVRDEKGQKMSKSKGNVVDPLVLIDQFGADALRFTLAAMAAQGRDIKLATSRIEGYRNFGTKLWNAARFAELNGCGRVAGFDPATTRSTLNRWVLSAFAGAVADVTAALEAYRFNDAAGAAYRFVWNLFCDWYLEFAKPVFAGQDAAEKAETQATTAYVLDGICALLHPFMPFITEELWGITGATGPARDSVLALAPWPSVAHLSDAAAQAELDWVIALISTVRSIRSELNVPAGATVPLVLVEASAEVRRRAERWGDILKRLGRFTDIGFADEAPRGAVQAPLPGAVAALPLATVIDVAAEAARLGKEGGKLRAEAGKLESKLANPGFLNKASPEVIEETRERLAELQARAGKLDDALRQISG
ncbi:valine--tRNA ligase [Lichenihabitans sp. Uapishka_5]|uniref:valine--tRNA ligase n=1 Tax=Lichenihabitans sp. Uapishka_5 TaxID=3037302 RepID=UPI0029E7EB0A|nr:valine--tRNA ligase [Lichenihabitans sp. Uapishka_5]MDX7949931.1 valine--tRNA ligase [Lichenihabitans sp. Uapishka_5]